VFESLYSDQSSPASQEVGLFLTDRVTDRVEHSLSAHRLFNIRIGNLGFRLIDPFLNTWTFTIDFDFATQRLVFDISR